MSPSADELARAFARGEAWAYEAAYRIHGDALFAAARRVLNDASDAQDCVHDVMVRLWQRRHVFTPERGSLRAFLAVCARNEALTRARNTGTRERILARSLVPAPPAPDHGEDVVERESVGRALNALTDKQRETIEMAYYQCLTHPEIAERTGEPVGTVKSRLSGALRRLREHFAAEESTHV
jgi:RNA polymerase sigma-70 factor (ECF subfamily)